MESSTIIEGTATPVSNITLAGVLRVAAVRQILLLIGVAAAVAAGFAIAIWAQSPGYTQLYGNLDASEAADIADALRAADIDFKLDAASGDILVPESSLHDARMRLASQGLPGSAAAGMAGLSEASSFGTSQFMENARYQHALEAELARTISSLGAVREARVHLALPNESAFIRDRKTASASVLVHLFRGRSLDTDQAAAIVNLVASSVPNLQSRNVTVVDQFGSLLSTAGHEPADAQATTQFKYTRRLEDSFKTRIEDLLVPLVGVGRVRAEVVADIDFTYVEETRESYDPNSTVVRSEQVSEDLRRDNGSVAAGVPGALSNQPPAAQPPLDATVAAQATTEPSNSSRSSIRNFEVDRTISHTRPQSGTVRRLSVAVLVDESPLEEGGTASPLSDAELARYTSLVKEAVGFNEARGDTVVVLGGAFKRVAADIAAEPPAIWEKPVVRDVLKQVLGALIVLAIAFGIVRPMLRSVVSNPGPAPLTGEYLGAGQGGAMPAVMNPVSAGATPMPNYDEKVAAAKNITGHDPARVAQVVKAWVAGDA